MDVDIEGFIKKKRLVSKFYHASVGLFFIINILLTVLLLLSHVNSKNQTDEYIYLVQENGDIFLKNGKGDKVQNSNNFYIQDPEGEPRRVTRENAEVLLQAGYNPIKIEDYKNLIEKKNVSNENLVLLGLLWIFFLAYLVLPSGLKNFYRFIMKE